MASSEKTIKNRNERKKEEKKEGNKTIECDIQLIRHLQTTRAPNIILHDNDLKMEWVLHTRSALCAWGHNFVHAISCNFTNKVH